MFDWNRKGKAVVSVIFLKYTGSKIFMLRREKQSMAREWERQHSQKNMKTKLKRNLQSGKNKSVAFYCLHFC